MHKEVFEKQLKIGLKSIKKANSKFWMQQRKKRGEFKVGDKVLVNPTLRKSKKKGKFGKGFYPYSGEVVEVLSGGKYYKVKWGLSHPPKEKQGSVVKKKFRIDQLIHNQRGEEIELVLQHYLQADSYNTETIRDKLPNLVEILRQRKNTCGDLEVLCVWKKKVAPTWEWVRDVGSTKQYKDFLQNLEYHQAMKEAGRKEELKEGRFEVERIFYQVGNEVLLLWKNFDDPEKVNVNKVKHLEVFQEWRKEGRVVVMEEEESTEEGSEMEESEEEDFESEGIEEKGSESEEYSTDGKEEVTEENREESQRREEAECDSDEEFWLKL